MSGSTAGPAFKHVVASVDELRALMGEPSEVALRKDIGRRVLERGSESGESGIFNLNLPPES